MANDYFLLTFNIKEFEAVVLPCLKDVLLGCGQELLLQLLRSQSKLAFQDVSEALDAGGQISLARLIGDEIPEVEMYDLAYSVGSSLFHIYCKSNDDAFINLTGSGLLSCLEREDTRWRELLITDECRYPREMVHACLGPGSRILKPEEILVRKSESLEKCISGSVLAEEALESLIEVLDRCQRDDSLGVALVMEW